MITFFLKFIHIILFVILRLYFLNPIHTFCIQITNFIPHTLSPSLYLSYIFYTSIIYCFACKAYFLCTYWSYYLQLNTQLHFFLYLTHILFSFIIFYVSQSHSLFLGYIFLTLILQLCSLGYNFYTLVLQSHISSLVTFFIRTLP